MELEFVKCHGSGNDFVMVDGVGQDLQGLDLYGFAIDVCDREKGIGADGLLLLVRYGEGYAMRMFNPDGSEAEMCGNGIRCVARLARTYTGCEHFVLGSGGRAYEVSHCPEIWPGVETYGVDIPVSMWSRDFAMFGEGGTFVGQPLPELDGELRFTALSLGNPHIVARCDRVDMQLLERLGERVKELPGVFPNGVNVSLYEVSGENSIFVATYERGAGITLSCGTAMTASSTAAALSGACGFGTPVEVHNRGGMVICECRREPLVTRLSGNATFEYAGLITTEGTGLRFDVEKIFSEEINAYGEFAEGVKKEI